MKQVLSKAQVNANLDQIKKGKAVCYKIHYNQWTEHPVYYVWFRCNGMAVIFGKKVYFRLFKDASNYTVEDQPFITEFSGIQYIPSRDKEWNEKMLKACGLMAEKKIKEVTPEQRLRQLDLQNLIPIYKMMLDVDLINADLETKYKKDYWGNEKTHEPFMALVVRHTKGSFSIPIDNYPEEVQNIFFNALNLPVTSKLKTA